MFRLLSKLPSRSLSVEVSGFEDESSDAAKLGRAADVMKGHEVFVEREERERKKARAGQGGGGEEEKECTRLAK